MYTSDWTVPPQTRGEWMYRLGVTLMVTLQRPIRDFPIDADALYNSGVTYYQAAVACANAHKIAH